MYITTIYSKLSVKQQNKIKNFLKNNFDSSKSIQNINFELEPMTIIILVILDNIIVGCVCLYNNKFLIEKLNNNNISLSNYSINNINGCFIYNLCVHKNYRKKKIGSNLINNLIEQMFNLKIDYLHTQAENEISQILFLKNGFMEDSFFNKPGTDIKIYIMSKYL